MIFQSGARFFSPLALAAVLRVDEKRRFWLLRASSHMSSA
jgi:hypothetical protein